MRAVIFLLVLCPGTVVTAQDLSRISVNEDRPLAYAVMELSRQLGITITFEEMEFQHPDDFHAVPWRSETLVVPKSGEFNFEYDPADPESEIVGSLLAAYHESFPGTYEIIEETHETNGNEAAVFHIVPGSSKNGSGTYVPRSSVLDVPLSFDWMNPAYVDTVICAVIQQAAELQAADIGCLNDSFGAWSLMGRVIYEYHAENMPVRTHLLNLLDETGHHLSWIVNRSSASGSYAVVFFPVSRPEGDF